MPMFALIMMLAVFPAMATDLYLPALPTIEREWGVSHATAGLTLSLFYAAYSVFLLIHGPLSDRHGRRPVLLAGLTAFLIGSLGSALAPSLTVMIAARVLQGIGASAANGLVLALAKDCFDGARRQRAMAYIGVIVPLCPMVAPTLGAVLLEALSWRAIFVVQGVTALLPFYGAWRMAEPLSADLAAAKADPERRRSAGLKAVWARYARLFRNRAYLFYTLGFAMMTLSFYAYIGSASDIYILGFGTSEFVFALLFCVNGAALMAGAFVCAKLSGRLAPRRLMALALVGLGLAAVGMLLAGADTAASFAAGMFAVSLFLGVSCPLGNYIALEEVQSDVGTAAALLSFWMALVGSAGMVLASLDWPSKPVAIGWMALAGALFPAAAMIGTRRPSGSGMAGPQIH